MKGLVMRRWPDRSICGDGGREGGRDPPQKQRDRAGCVRQSAPGGDGLIGHAASKRGTYRGGIAADFLSSLCEAGPLRRSRLCGSM